MSLCIEEPGHTLTVHMQLDKFVHDTSDERRMQRERMQKMFLVTLKLKPVLASAKGIKVTMCVQISHSPDLPAPSLPSRASLMSFMIRVAAGAFFYALCSAGVSAEAVSSLGKGEVLLCLSVSLNQSLTRLYTSTDSDLSLLSSHNEGSSKAGLQGGHLTAENRQPPQALEDIVPLRRGLPQRI